MRMPTVSRAWVITEYTDQRSEASKYYVRADARELEAMTASIR
jgi:hypothetical protein